MRNGLNVTGVSEMVHEMRELPAEAVADFSVACPAAPAADGTVTAATRTARIGTLRAARPFTLTHRLSGAPGPVGSHPSPYESAIAALAACALITQVNGLTARGVTIGSLQVTARAELQLDGSGRPAAGRPLENIRWRCDVECDAPTDTVESVIRLVTAFSPNHRAFTDACLFDRVSIDGRPLADPYAPADPAGPASTVAGTTTVEAMVVWEYGSEATYTTATSVEGTRRTTVPGTRAHTVDQAKQMLGIDKGPNSQEILLAAVCAELHAVVDATPATAPLLRAGGRLDNRGMMNVLRSAPSRFHDLSLDVVAPQVDVPSAADLVRAALARSVLVATLSHARTVDVELWHNGTRALSCATDTAGAEAMRDELTRRAAAQAATAGAGADDTRTADAPDGSVQ
ncbi:OsmC family protein [Streptomyces sp. NPDC001393]